MQIEPYLFFDGRAEEAAAFYQQALGAKLELLMRFKESPEPASVPPDGEDKVMHMSLKIGGSRLMGSDGHCQGAPKFASMSLSLTVVDEAEAQRVFAALCEGGDPDAARQDLFQPQIRHAFRPLRRRLEW